MRGKLLSSFISDDRGITEPYSDIISMMLVIVGFTVFFAVVVQTYSAYADRAFIVGHSQDAFRLTEALKTDPLFASADGVDTIDANRVNAAAEHPERLYSRYGSYYNFMVKVEANEQRWSKTIIRDKNPRSIPQIGIAFSTPVTVRLNDAESVPGTLSVKIWRK